VEEELITLQRNGVLLAAMETQRSLEDILGGPKRSIEKEQTKTIFTHS
jgi:hypothetical protein